MAITQGEWGLLVVEEDFHPMFDINTSTSVTTYVPGTGRHNLGRATYFSVNEGTIGYTVDEANGVVALTTDTGDNDNVGVHAGTWLPSVNGPLVMEARFKFSVVDSESVFVGFTQTLALDTPVMPAEFATTTMTYNGTGQMLGAQLDFDGTAIDWRACAGTGGAVTGTNRATGLPLVNAGVRANETITADEWYIVRVELDESGRGSVYVGHKGRSLDLIAEIDGLATTNVLYAIAMYENRAAGADIFEVDYIRARGARDWEVT